MVKDSKGDDNPDFRSENDGINNGDSYREKQNYPFLIGWITITKKIFNRAFKSVRLKEKKKKKENKNI